MCDYEALLSWDAFYTSAAPSPSKYIDNTRHSLSCNVYVLNSYFGEYTTSSSGGSIYISNTSALVLIEETSFYKITSSSYAIALHMEKVKSVVYNKVCGCMCKSTKTSTDNWGCFDRIYVVDSINNINNIYESSICYTEREKGYATLWHCCGTILINTANVSNNKCMQSSAIRIQSFEKSGTITSNFSYTSFTNNTASTDYYCVLIAGKVTAEMKACNVVYNYQKQSYYGLISTEGQLTITNSSILKNDSPVTFQSTSSSFLLVTGCIVDYYATSGPVSIEKAAVTSFINAIFLSETGNCEAKQLAIGTLSPFVNIKKTKKIICKAKTIN